MRGHLSNCPLFSHSCIQKHVHEWGKKKQFDRWPTQDEYVSCPCISLWNTNRWCNEQRRYVRVVLPNVKPMRKISIVLMRSCRYYIKMWSTEFHHFVLNGWKKQSIQRAFWWWTVIDFFCNSAVDKQKNEGGAVSRCEVKSIG